MSPSPSSVNVHNTKDNFITYVVKKIILNLLVFGCLAAIFWKNISLHCISSMGTSLGTAIISLLVFHMFWRYYGPIILKGIPKIGATFAGRETKCLIMLYQILITRFNRDELITLCFHMGVDYEDLPDRGRANKARELIKYLARHEQVSELINIGCELRPDIS